MHAGGLQVQRLAQQACDQLGSIDIWVNNAGQSQSPRTALTATPASTVQQIVGTNLVGALLGSQAAMAVMQQQDTGEAQLWIRTPGAHSLQADAAPRMSCASFF